MREGWLLRLVVLGAAIAALVVVLLVVEDGSTSTAEAIEAIEAMPGRVRIVETSDHVLVGTIRGRLASPVHFAIARSRDARGIPPRLRRLDSDPTGGGGFLVWSDGEIYSRGESAAAWRERGEIAVGIEEALCRKATGNPCGI